MLLGKFWSSQSQCSLEFSVSAARPNEGHMEQTERSDCNVEDDAVMIISSQKEVHGNCSPLTAVFKSLKDLKIEEFNRCDKKPMYMH